MSSRAEQRTQQPVEVVIGPRIGDQSDRQTGTYALPPQVVAYSLDGSHYQIPGASITPPFATITAVDHSSNQIVIDKPVAGDVDQVELVAEGGATFLGYARVMGRDSGSQTLSLDALPQGTIKGVGVAQGFDTVRQGYQWAGVTDHYFAMLAVSEMPISEIRLTNVQLKQPGHDVPQDYPSLAVPVRASSQIQVFVGPKDRTCGRSAIQVGANLSHSLTMEVWVLGKPVIPALGGASTAQELFQQLRGDSGDGAVNLTLRREVIQLKEDEEAAKHQTRMKSSRQMKK